MGTIWVREFTGGLDKRRMAVASTGGTLIEATDVHISRGGEIETRAAFVPTFDLPAGTTGLAYNRTGPVVFGSGPEPAGLPEGVTYQRLQHPSPQNTLVRVFSTDLYAGKLYVSALFSDGGLVHFYDGVYVADWYDGRARAPFEIVSGSSGATVQVFVNGVAASGVVAWAGSSSQTAAAIAASISSVTSSPEYTGSAADARVTVLAAEAGAEANGRTVTFNVTGDMTIGAQGSSNSPGLTMQGGASPENTYQPGSFVKTIGSKMYSVSGPNTHFSGIQQPTKWTTDTTGAGFIDMSSQAAGSEELTALAKYQSYVAVFAERNIQIWYFDPDPSLNKQTQVLNNTGTGSPLSVTQFGDNDLFYLNESGLRSLRARDSSNAAATTDIGVPVDALVQEALEGMTDEERMRIIGVIEPQDGRFWLVMKDRIFVFSYFSGARVSAWSTYLPTYRDGDTTIPFTVDDVTVYRQRVYLRAGNRIFVYGGVGPAQVFDDTSVRVRLPFLDAEAPSKVKTLTGIDAAMEGVWRVSVSLDPNNLDALDVVGTLTETTFNLNRIPAQGRGTHLSLLLESVGAGPHRLGSLIMHYEADADED